MAETGALLAVKDLEAWYGESHILHGVTFDVRPGEVVTLLGRNGVGKTTTLKAVMGIIESRTGSVRFYGRELINRPSNANFARIRAPVAFLVFAPPDAGSIGRGQWVSYRFWRAPEQENPMTPSRSHSSPPSH